MDATSNPLIGGVVIAAAIQGLVQILNRVLSDPTSKKANEINANRLLLEKENADIAHRQKQTEQEAALRKELRDENKELRTENHALEKEIDAWRNRCIQHGNPCQVTIILRPKNAPPDTNTDTPDAPPAP